MTGVEPRNKLDCILLLDLNKFVQYTTCMTEKQLHLLKFIRNTIAHSGKAPTFRLMRSFMDATSNQAVEDCLSILERDGYILRSGSIRREIKLTHKGTSQDEPVLKLGTEENSGVKPYLETELPFNNETGTITPFSSTSAYPLPVISASVPSMSLNSFIKGRSEGTS